MAYQQQTQLPARPSHSSAPSLDTRQPPLDGGGGSETTPHNLPSVEAAEWQQPGNQPKKFEPACSSPSCGAARKRIGMTVRRHSDCVARMERMGIKMVCVDFDQTLVSCHTKGWWVGSAQDLAKHARAPLVGFMQQCLEHGLHVAICTFSTQEELIASVLGILFPDFAHKIPILGGHSIGAQTRVPESWDCKRELHRNCLKVNHICRAVTQLGPDVNIKAQNVLLIDDDQKNIVAALDYGVCALHMKIKGHNGANAEDDLMRRIASMEAPKRPSYIYDEAPCIILMQTPPRMIRRNSPMPCLMDQQGAQGLQINGSLSKRIKQSPDEDAVFAPPTPMVRTLDQQMSRAISMMVYE